MKLPQAESVDGMLDLAWSLLGRGVVQASHGFHLPVLSTIGEGGWPRGRVVVLRRAERSREAWSGAGLLACHTDTRSPKTGELRTDGRTEWVFWDQQNKVQVRAGGRSVVQTHGVLADEQWALSLPSSRRAYLAPHAPGSASEAPSSNVPESLQGRVPTIEETEAGRQHFALIVTTIESLDVLHLAAGGHRRVRCSAARQGWVEP